MLTYTCFEAESHAETTELAAAAENSRHQNDLLSTRFTIGSLQESSQI